MTLSVDVFVLDEKGERRFLAYENPGDDMAGVESLRQLLYGCDTAIRLGLTMLPALRDTFGVYARTSQELAQMEHEATTLLQNLTVIFPGIPLDDKAGPACRLRNILKAVDRARRVGGSVVIW